MSPLCFWGWGGDDNDTPWVGQISPVLKDGDPPPKKKRAHPHLGIGGGGGMRSVLGGGKQQGWPLCAVMESARPSRRPRGALTQRLLAPVGNEESDVWGHRGGGCLVFIPPPLCFGARLHFGGGGGGCF